jgi:hypothetical protein
VLARTRIFDGWCIDSRWFDKRIVSDIQNIDLDYLTSKTPKFEVQEEKIMIFRIPVRLRKSELWSNRQLVLFTTLLISLLLSPWATQPVLFLSFKFHSWSCVLSGRVIRKRKRCFSRRSTEAKVASLCASVLMVLRRLVVAETVFAKSTAVKLLPNRVMLLVFPPDLFERKVVLIFECAQSLVPRFW